MTDDALPRLHGKPTLIAKIAPWLLIIPSALIGVILVEVFCWLFVPSIGSNLPGRDPRVVFYDGRGPIFENHGDIFTYLPHNEIHNVTGFFSDHDFAVEYDYRFRTNNFGLAQDADIRPEQDSLLLLGDSFTEGVGAGSWFGLVAPSINKLGYQPVNGGVMGTGFRQWLKLGRYLAGKKIQVRKVVVLFISDDYHRPVWNIPPALFECLSAPPLCRVEDSYYYRLPPQEEVLSWIAKVRTARERPLRPRLELSVSALLPVSAYVYRFFKQIIMLQKMEKDSSAAIDELVRTYGPNNIAFIHLPQKDEIERGPDGLGLKARRAIEEAGGKLFDGFKLCQLTKTDYHLHDDHPNKGGYSKIAACAANVIAEFQTGVNEDAARESSP